MSSRISVSRASTPLLIAVLIALFAFAAADARAAVPYPIETIAESAQAFEGVSIGSDDRGDQFAVWRHALPSGEAVVEASERPAGGSWTAPAPISPVGAIESVDLAVDASGEAAATWMRLAPFPQGTVEVARLDGGTWGAPVSIPGTVGITSVEPQVGIDTEGKATVAWREYLGSNYGIAVAAEEGSAWGPSELLSDPSASETFEAPQLAVAPDGAAVVDWHTSSVIEASTRPAGGSWSPREVVATSVASGLDQPVAAITPDGEAILAWTLRGSGSESVIDVSAHPLGGSWTGRTISETAGLNLNPSLAVSRTGEVVAAWINAFTTVQSATRDAGGTWRSAESLPAPAGSNELYWVTAGIDAEGAVTLAYEGYSFETRAYPLWLIRRPASGAWTEAMQFTTELEESYATPGLAVDPAGDVGVAWAAFAPGAPSAVRSFAIDAAATLTVTKAGPGSGVVTAADGGIDCGATCTATYPRSSQVTLTATAASGSAFSGWSGDCTGTGTCTVSMSAARSVGAEFTVATPETEAKTDPDTKVGTEAKGPGAAPPSQTGSEGTLRLVKVKRNKARGVGMTRYRVPGAGTLIVFGAGIRTTTVSTKGPGFATVKLIPKGSYRARLLTNRRGFSTVKATFHPAGGGTPRTWARRIRLVRRQG